MRRGNFPTCPSVISALFAARSVDARFCTLRAREHRLTDVAQRRSARGIIEAERRIAATGAAQLCDLGTYASLRASLLAINIPESSGKKRRRG